MNQAMKIGTPNEMKSDFITAWDDGRSLAHPLEWTGSDAIFERYAQSLVSHLIMKRLKQLFSHKNLFIALVLLLANGWVWASVAGAELLAVEPILHPDVATVRAHWQARDAVGESFSIRVNERETMETITWFIAPRPNLPFSHPQVEFLGNNEVVGGGKVHVLGLEMVVNGRATIELINGKPIATIHELRVGNAKAPAAVVSLVDQAQGIYDQLSLPIEITRIEILEGEAIIEGVYR